MGGIRTINDLLAVFGSDNFDTTGASPRRIALLGFAVAFPGAPPTLQNDPKTTPAADLEQALGGCVARPRIR